MAKLYKIKKGGRVSKELFRFKEAKRLKRKYSNKGIEVELIRYPGNYKILDYDDTGIVIFFKKIEEED